MPVSRSASCPGQWKVGTKHSGCYNAPSFSTLEAYLCPPEERKISQVDARTQRVLLGLDGTVSACVLWWIADNETCWASRHEKTLNVIILSLDLKKKRRRRSFCSFSAGNTRATWHRPTNMPLHPRVRAQHHHTGLHETRTARFTQNAVSK